MEVQDVANNAATGVVPGEVLDAQVVDQDVEC